MRVALIVAFAALAMPDAKADPYAWCAEYGGGRGGATNCGFVTLEQCMWTVSGIGGFCRRNLFYTGPAEGAPLRAKSAKKRQQKG
jgi:hypothetical protein